MSLHFLLFQFVKFAVSFCFGLFSSSFSRSSISCLILSFQFFQFIFFVERWYLFALFIFGWYLLFSVFFQLFFFTLQSDCFCCYFFQTTSAGFFLFLIIVDGFNMSVYSSQINWNSVERLACILQLGWQTCLPEDRLIAKLTDVFLPSWFVILEPSL